MHNNGLEVVSVFSSDFANQADWIMLFLWLEILDLTTLQPLVIG